MIYILPNGNEVDLGEYTKEDLVGIDEEQLTQIELSELLFQQCGILVGNLKGGG